MVKKRGNISYFKRDIKFRLYTLVKPGSLGVVLLFILGKPTLLSIWSPNTVYAYILYYIATTAYSSIIRRVTSIKIIIQIKDKDLLHFLK